MNKFLSKYSMFALGALALFGATTYFAAAANDATLGQNTDPLGRHQFGEERRMQHVEDVATILDASAEDIKTAMEEGQRLPEIIESYGYDQETFQEAMHQLHLEELKTRLDEKVANGDITQEEADEMYANAESRDFFHLGKGGKGPHRGDCMQDTDTEEVAE